MLEQYPQHCTFMLDNYAPPWNLCAVPSLSVAGGWISQNFPKVQRQEFQVGYCLNYTPTIIYLQLWIPKHIVELIVAPQLPLHTMQWSLR